LLRRFLDKKVTKPERSESMTTFKNNKHQGINQGLELISDKFVKAFLVASTSPDEESVRACCLGVVGGAKALTFSPSIISYTG